MQPLLLLAFLALCPQTETQHARASDLRKLDEWIEVERSFSDERRAEAHRAIAAHLERGDAFDDAAFYMEVRRIVALADNGHSNADDSPIHERFGLLPLRTYWFSDGPRVVQAREAWRGLLGARIERIEGRPIAEVEAGLRAYCGGTVEYFRAYTEALLFLSPALMHAAGLAERPDRLRLALTSRDGEALEKTVEVDRASSAFRARPWRYLSPAPIEGGEGWFAQAAGVEPPLWLRDEGEAFRYELLAGGQVAYIQLRGNRDSGAKRIRDFAARTRERLEQDHPRSIVLDNRANGGGDLTTTAEFALELPSWVQGGRVYVLTGNATFSAGIYTSFFPKASDPENTLVVGELVGDRPEFWAEASDAFLLPESGYALGYALERHDLLRGCTAPGCHMARHPAHWNLVVDTLEPDWPVAYAFADFAAGRDPVLERVLEAEAGAR